MGEDIIMKGEPFHYAEGKKSGEKGTKLVTKKTLKRQLRKLVKKAAKVEKKLKAKKKECKERRRKPDITFMASQFIGNHVVVSGPSHTVPLHFAEVESYEEAEMNIKGMFNGKSKDDLYQQLDAIDLDIQEMKRKYKKEKKNC